LALSHFLSRDKVGIILGFISLALVIAAICAFLIIRKRRQRRVAGYQHVEPKGGDEPPFIWVNMQRHSVGPEPSDQPVYNPYVPEEHRSQSGFGEEDAHNDVHNIS